jgi:hypothetical protein
MKTEQEEIFKGKFLVTGKYLPIILFETNYLFTPETPSARYKTDTRSEMFT